MDFSNLLAGLKKANFTKDRNEILKYYSQYFTAAQAVQVINLYPHASDKIGALETMIPRLLMLSGQDGKIIVSAFTFAGDKLKAVKLIASHVNDPSNKHVILEAIDFHFDREKAKKILDEATPVNQGTSFYPPAAVQVECQHPPPQVQQNYYSQSKAQPTSRADYQPPPQQAHHNYYSPPQAQPTSALAYQPPQAAPYQPHSAAPYQPPPQAIPYPPQQTVQYPPPSSAPYPPSNAPYQPPQTVQYPPPSSAPYAPPSNTPYQPPQPTPYPLPSAPTNTPYQPPQTVQYLPPPYQPPTGHY